MPESDIQLIDKILDAVKGGGFKRPMSHHSIAALREARAEINALAESP